MTCMKNNTRLWNKKVILTMHATHDMSFQPFQASLNFILLGVIEQCSDFRTGTIDDISILRLAVIE